MPNREKVIKGLEYCIKSEDCRGCIYWEGIGLHEGCPLHSDALALLKEQYEEHRRLLSWLGKFCRHIDNRDTWLTDKENIAFFKEKMKQQFGWELEDL